jgi:hypothetical protein
MNARSAVPASWIRPKSVRRSEGHRGAATADLQIICGAGPYEIDVLVREHASPEGLDVTGQVTRAENLHEPIPSLPLTLVEAEQFRSVEEGRTDDYGEFAFGHHRKGVYGLRLGTDANAPCVLVWEGDV